MEDTLDELSTLHLEVLQEVGNIGAGNAVTALSQMMSKKINMDVPRVGILPVGEVTALVGREEDLVICIHQSVAGDAPSAILFLLEQESAFLLADLILSRERGTTREISEVEISLFKEVGNILGGSILNALSQMTGITFRLSVPAFAHDMLGAVLSTALVESGWYADQVLVVETHFQEESAQIKGHFFLLPEIEALQKILAALGLNL